MVLLGDNHAPTSDVAISWAVNVTLIAIVISRVNCGLSAKTVYDLTSEFTVSYQN